MKDRPEIALWWDSANGRWQVIDYDDFARARGYGSALGLPSGDNLLKGIPAGEHKFVICIVDDGTLVNAIVHRYILNDVGAIIETPTTLTEEQKSEWQYLYLLHTMSIEEEQRLRELQDQEVVLLVLTKQELDALLRDMSWNLPSDMGFGVWRHYHRVYGEAFTRGGSAN